METYSSFRPTQFDHHYQVEDRENWLLLQVSRTRDSDCLSNANFDETIKLLGEENEENYEVHRFGHWGTGWFEIILINPENKEIVKIGNEIESSLAGYPVLNEERFSEYEMNEANETWKNCFNVKGRVEYIRNNKRQFEFQDFKDLIGCIRGKYFSGYASELIG